MPKKPMKNTLIPKPRAVGRRMGYQVNLNSAEADLVDAAAARAGMTRAAFMRQASIEKATRTP